LARQPSPASQRRPYFFIGHGENQDLLAAGCRQWSYYAASLLQVLDPADATKRSGPLTFRLDTGAFASAIPEEWVREKRLRPFLGPLSSPVTVGGVAGTTSGRLARGVRVEFCGFPERTYLFDFLVLASLNRRRGQTKDPFGVIALRDLANNFVTLEVRGEFVLKANGEPLAKPELVLVPA
jgi:hypothetical protein